MINGVLKKQHLSILKEEFNFLNNIGYGDLNYEALYKWACVIYNVKQLNLTSEDEKLNFVEIGGGLSPVQFYFSNFAKISNVEKWVRGAKKTWFNTDEDLLYSKSNKQNFDLNRDNINFISNHFFSFATSQKAESVDLVYDCCSAIHINRNNGAFKKTFSKFLDHVHRILKPNGYFVATMDIMHPSRKEFKEFVHVDTLLDIFDNSKLSFVTDFDKDIETFFLNIDNMHIPTSLTPIAHKGTDKMCSASCKYLQKEHLLFDGARNKTFLRASFVLRREQ